MLIQHKEDGNEGVFYIEQNGEELAEMTYTLENGKMVIDHTEVDESLRGKNIGHQLVEHGVEYAREQHLKVLPVCEYAKSVIERTKNFRDVL
jgi:predicted GNAT family acetyltransferase